MVAHTDNMLTCLANDFLPTQPILTLSESEDPLPKGGDSAVRRTLLTDLVLDTV